MSRAVPLLHHTLSWSVQGVIYRFTVYIKYEQCDPNPYLLTIKFGKSLEFL